MRVFKATGLRYRINIVSGGDGVYILSGVKEKRQESEINTIVWVFQLLLAGIVATYCPSPRRPGSLMFVYRAKRGFLAARRQGKVRAKRQNLT